MHGPRRIARSLPARPAHTPGGTTKLGSFAFAADLRVALCLSPAAPQRGGLEPDISVAR